MHATTSFLFTDSYMRARVFADLTSAENNDRVVPDPVDEDAEEAADEIPDGWEVAVPGRPSKSASASGLAVTLPISLFLRALLPFPSFHDP